MKEKAHIMTLSWVWPSPYTFCDKPTSHCDILRLSNSDALLRQSHSLAVFDWFLWQPITLSSTLFKRVNRMRIAPPKKINHPAALVWVKKRKHKTFFRLPPYLTYLRMALENSERTSYKFDCGATTTLTQETKRGDGKLISKG